MDDAVRVRDAAREAVMDIKIRIRTEADLRSAMEPGMHLEGLMGGLPKRRLMTAKRVLKIRIQSQRKR